MTDNPLKTRVTPHFTMLIDAEDGTPPKEWKLSYTYKAIAKIEEATGLDLKKIDDWKNISSGKHFPVIVWGGLEKFNPEVTLDEVRDMLNPEAQRLLTDRIFELMFPGVTEAFLKAKEQGGAKVPNVQLETTNV